MFLSHTLGACEAGRRAEGGRGGVGVGDGEGRGVGRKASVHRSEEQESRTQNAKWGSCMLPRAYS